MPSKTEPPARSQHCRSLFQTASGLAAIDKCLARGRLAEHVDHGPRSDNDPNRRSTLRLLTMPSAPEIKAEPNQRLLRATGPVQHPP